LQVRTRSRAIILSYLRDMTCLPTKGTSDPEMHLVPIQTSGRISRLTARRRAVARFPPANARREESQAAVSQQYRHHGPPRTGVRPPIAGFHLQSFTCRARKRMSKSSRVSFCFDLQIAAHQWAAGYFCTRINPGGGDTSRYFWSVRPLQTTRNRLGGWRWNLESAPALSLSCRLDLPWRP
jgi:hypothetical protein